MSCGHQTHVRACPASSGTRTSPTGKLRKLLKTPHKAEYRCRGAAGTEAGGACLHSVLQDGVGCPVECAFLCAMLSLQCGEGPRGAAV